MNSYSLSDRGLERGINQDVHVEIQNERFSFFAVCDGMGGHRAGEVAAQMAVDYMKEYIESHMQENIAGMLTSAVQYANKKIYEKSLEDEKYFGMGTTAVCAVVSDRVLTTAHVGDSRLYRYRNGEFQQLTTDHSLVQDLVSEGVLTPEDAKVHPVRNAVTRAVGLGDEVEVELHEFEVQDLDYYLLCSDGLTNMVEDYEIQNIFSKILSEDSSNIKKVVEELVEQANKNGGKDNITATIFQIGEMA